MRRVRTAVPAAVLLLAAIAALTLPYQAHAFSLKPTTRAAQNACTGLDRVQIPDPESTEGERNYYYVCCQGEALRFQCMVPSAPSLVLEYSDARDAKYNPLQGQCERYVIGQPSLVLSTIATFKQCVLCSPSMHE
jgi:hypothetical protein